MTDAVAIVEEKILKEKGRFTQTEASTATGLSLDATKDALEALIEKYVCRLQVTENGDLIYDFGTRPRRRGAKSIGELLEIAGDWLWKAFTVVFKIWIALTLVVYFVVFLAILVAITVAAASSGKGEGRGRNFAGDAVSNAARVFFSIFQWSTITGHVGYRTDDLGYRFRTFTPKPAVLNEKKKSFIASVYDFVFGPPRVELDPLNNEKEVAAYLRDGKGIVAPSELMALAGWNLSEAQAFFTDCLVRFQGEVRVTDEEGAMYGEFDRIVRGVGDMETGQVIRYWDEYEPVYEWTGNTAGRNVLVAGMNGFNLLFSAVLLFNYPAILQTLGYDAYSMNVASGPVLALGWVPLVFSLIFFLVPLLRYPRIRIQNRRRREENVRKRMYRAIFDFRGKPVTVDRAASAANRAASEEKLDRETVAGWLDTLYLDLGGNTDVSETAEVVYSFPRITDELNAVERLRRRKRVDRDLGGIIAETS